MIQKDKRFRFAFTCAKGVNAPDFNRNNTRNKEDGEEEMVDMRNTVIDVQSNKQNHDEYERIHDEIVYNYREA